LKLPEVDKFLPTAKQANRPWRAPRNWGSLPAGGEWHPIETTTMPGWAGSSWYFLRYMDPHNTGRIRLEGSRELLAAGGPLHGRQEHATGHLLYVRFWTKFLKDLGWICLLMNRRRSW
jgi:leucyl-tRNA synthetase